MNENIPQDAEVKFLLTNHAHKVIVDALGTNGGLVIDITRVGPDTLRVSLQHKGIPVLQMPDVHCDVGDRIQLNELRVGLDLDFGQDPVG